MHGKMMVILFLTALLPVAGGMPAVASDWAVWAVDPLVKVFQDATPATGQTALAEVARGEHASLQVVLRSEAALKDLKAHVSDFRMEGGGGALKPIAPRFVGYVPVDRPTQLPSKDQLRLPPADYPDPLLEAPSIEVAAAQAQPIWITVAVPLDAEPGLYQSTLEIEASADGETLRAQHPLSIKVYPAQVGRARLWVTDWFAINSRHLEINPDPESEEYYALMRRYARNLADHRHNVALISPLSLAQYRLDEDGALQIDFSRFDKWVNIFIEEGVIGLIEGGHIGGRKGPWLSQFAVRIQTVQEDGSVVASSVDPDSGEADAFYSVYFPALVNHLRERGWLDQYVQHLADEPITTNIRTYRAIAELLKKYAPELRIIEATHAKDLTGSMDVWVPQLNFLHKDFDHYQERQAAGDEVWFYTCVFPQGEYANRFIEQPLMKTRLLHWINYRYGITGYLHWGYNKWADESPYTHTTRPHPGPPYLPAGDPWIVYPGIDGPFDSIRFEAMRDGIADHEMLSLLGERDPEAAARLAAIHILDFDSYETDVETFRATRRELLELLSR